jgi:hypothetical protein
VIQTKTIPAKKVAGLAFLKDTISHKDGFVSAGFVDSVRSALRIPKSKHTIFHHARI